MNKQLDKSEVIFKIFAYVLVTLFAMFTLYPFIYTISAALSSKAAMNAGEVVLLPVGFQLEAFKDVFYDKSFWNSYTNTLYLTFFGTAWSMFVSITGGYALSKGRLKFRRQFNFFAVFTMWFSAGMIPQYLNFYSMGVDNRTGIVLAMGVQAFNIILLRNAFESVSHEIEEAAIIDGANEFQIITNVYIPMSRASIATVTLFYALSRWNGYFWASRLLSGNEVPLQVYLRMTLEKLADIEADLGALTTVYSSESMIYAMIVCSIIPIIVIYPYLQKYFATGVSVGGVKG